MQKKVQKERERVQVYELVYGLKEKSPHLQLHRVLTLDFDDRNIWSTVDKCILKMYSVGEKLGAER